MKKQFTMIIAIMFVFFFGNTLLAQPIHTIDFEPAGVGQDWNWVVSENDDNPPLEFIANPVSGGINTSPTVAKFIARQTGNPWALFLTGDDGEFTFDATNCTLKVMVYKTVISPVHLKLEGSGVTPIEIADTNTVVDQWEELTYDFTAGIGQTFNLLVVIPDFYARPQENIVYLDNIQIPDGQVVVTSEPTVHAPTPTVPAVTVNSIFSDYYPNVQGTNFNPNWGQSTSVTFVEIQGDTTMRYGNLNYQGIELGDTLDLIAGGMQFLHLDFWNANSTDLGVSIISPGPVETRVAIVPPDSMETWRSLDIPLTDFAPVDLSQVFQLKFDGNGTIYLDNIYFWNGVVPVELTSFSATVNTNKVQLNWNTATETNNSGFQVERKSEGDFKTVGFVNGAGTTTESKSYTFTDTDLTPGTYYYRLKQIDYDGTYDYSDQVEVNINTPVEFSLHQNYPNPFNPTTNIKFDLPEKSQVTLKVYNALGQEVASLVNEVMNSGSHEISFDAHNLTSGLYFYSISAGNFNAVKKMLLVK